MTECYIDCSAICPKFEICRKQKSGKIEEMIYVYSRDDSESRYRLGLKIKVEECDSSFHFGLKIERGLSAHTKS